jgi:hypothetical protein
MTPYRLNLRPRYWLAIFLALALLAGCTPPATPVPPSATPGATEPPPASGYICDPPAGRLDPISVQTGSHFVLNQVIISGTAGNVAKVIADLSSRNDGYKAIQTCRLGHLTAELPKVERWSEASGQRGPSDDFEFTAEEQRTLATSLLRTPAGISTEDAIAQVREIAARHRVMVDPNYLTGPLDDANPISPCGVPPEPGAAGLPFEVGGSPFEVGGSPFEVGGSSTGGRPADADAGIFRGQWAFKQVALWPDEAAQGDWRGQGVTVVIFDTSPYQPGERAVIVDPANRVDLDLRLHFPQMTNVLAPVPVPTASDTLTTPVTVDDHGLFAAGLVHAVAPDSSIHLVRVLNEYGCGDLWTLSNAINEFTAQHFTKRDAGKIVYNFSLGVHQPRDVDRAGWPRQIVALDKALRNAYGRGAVLVAAAGNDSYASTGPRPMQLPADLHYVIGVAASTITPKLACYSNKGDVIAPGGEGGGPTQDNKSTCQPLANLCDPMDPACPLGVVSLARHSATGYRFWVGTSFAAPLVSGQAALLLGDGLAASQTPRCIQSTMKVVNGQRVINIPASAADAADGQCP